MKYYRICQETCSKSLRCTAFAFQPSEKDLNAQGNDCYLFDFNDDSKLVCDGISEKIVQGERKGWIKKNQNVTKVNFRCSYRKSR